MQIKKYNFFVIIILIFTITLSVSAHPGRTDANGGHYNRKTGEYHYHNGGDSSSSSSSSGNYTNNIVEPKTVYASKINFVNSPKEIYIGEQIQLEASVYPSNAEDKQINWESDAPNIATVTSSGKLSAIGVGKATIKAKTSRGTSAQFIINIKEVIAESMKIKEKPSELFVNEKFHLSVEFFPTKTTNKAVEWKSENENIATISSSGELCAVSSGKTTISAIHKNFKDTFEIQVNSVEVKDVIIKELSNIYDNKETTKTLRKGKTMQLTAKILPENATNQAIKWSIDNKDIADIDENGLLTGHKTGTVHVIATSSNGVTDEIELKIYSNEILNVISFFIIICIIAGAIFLIHKKKKAS